MRSMTVLISVALACLVHGVPAFGQQAGGLWGRAALPGVGAPPPMQSREGAFQRQQWGNGGLGPLQYGAGRGASPWRPEGADRRAWRGSGLQPSGPGWRRDGWRRRRGGYGVGLVYPYFEDYGDEAVEEPVLPPPDVRPPPPPKPPPAGPRTVSAPAAAAATITPATSGGSLRCGKGRRVTLGSGRGGFGCISP